MFGVPPQLLRDGEGWAIDAFKHGRDAFYERDDYPARGPGVTAAATHWRYDRGVRVMGIDAWGWDRPLHMEAEDARRAGEPGIFWAAHQADLEYCQIERLANLAALPSTEFIVTCFPLKLVGGSAAPARVRRHSAELNLAAYAAQ